MYYYFSPKHYLKNTMICDYYTLKKSLVSQLKAKNMNIHINVVVFLSFGGSLSKEREGQKHKSCPVFLIPCHWHSHSTLSS